MLSDLKMLRLLDVSMSGTVPSEIGLLEALGKNTTHKRERLLPLRFDSDPLIHFSQQRFSAWENPTFTAACPVKLAC